METGSRQILTHSTEFFIDGWFSGGLHKVSLLCMTSEIEVSQPPPKPIIKFITVVVGLNRHSQRRLFSLYCVVNRLRRWSVGLSPLQRHTML